jgi:hypothetical protein
VSKLIQIGNSWVDPLDVSAVQLVPSRPSGLGKVNDPLIIPAIIRVCIAGQPQDFVVVEQFGNDAVAQSVLDEFAEKCNVARHFHDQDERLQTDTIRKNSQLLAESTQTLRQGRIEFAK